VQTEKEQLSVGMNSMLMGNVFPALKMLKRLPMAELKISPKGMNE